MRKQRTLQRRHQKSGAESLLYLKDWHFVQDFRKQYEQPYRTPTLFEDDWIQRVSDASERFSWSSGRGTGADDNRYVYHGTAGTVSYLHADVFRSYSWSSNIVGRKRWFLFRPDQTELLQGVHDICDHEGAADQRQARQARCLVVDQNAGETLFVPSGWHHQVHNLTDCLSVNQNWGNATNLDKMWRHIRQQCREVEHSIDDCRETCESEHEWNELVQRVLLANIGIDYAK
jgi:hypothetical protein